MNKDGVFDYLVSKEFTVIGIVDQVSGRDDEYFVYIKIERGRDGAQSPSNYKMIKAREELKALGSSIEFIVSDTLTNDAEAGLRATLLANHPDLVRNVFLSMEDDSARVWIDPKPEFSGGSDDVMRSVRSYFEFLNIELDSVALTNSDNLPSNFAILRLLRAVAPVILSDFSSALQGKGFTVPSEDWLRRKLESLRKKGQVVWIKGEAEHLHSYALTLSGLKSLGTEKRRSSPDVARLLAIMNRAK